MSDKFTFSNLSTFLFSFYLPCLTLVAGASCLVMSDSLQPQWTVACQVSLSMGIFQARILGWVATPSSRESSQPWGWTQVSRIVGRFFTVWATRETQEYWVGGLCLLQGNCPTQESNQGFLHRRKIVYQLSYQRSLIVARHLQCF